MLRQLGPSASLLAIGCLLIGNAACRDSATGPTEPLPTTIAGTVYDSASRPLNAVRVEVTSGADAGTFVLSDASGSFTMTADALASGSVSLQATKEGFATVNQTVTVTSDLTRVTLQLTPDILLDLAGEYAMRVDASGLCSTLPTVAQTRTYQATISPTNSRSVFNVTLSGASFFPNHNVFGAYVASDFARFVLYSPDFNERPVVEEVGLNAFVELGGEATAVVSQTSPVISAAFTGSIAYCATTSTPTSLFFVCPTTPTRCQASSHRLTLIPN